MPNMLDLPEATVRLDDPESGLSGVIVLHSTYLGPAAGGCRLWNYDTLESATTDAMRLAQGMSYKNALAGLPFGGGKAVIRYPHGDFNRSALFRAFGEAVAALDGSYVTAEDVGTTVEDMLDVSRTTRHVAGLPGRPGVPGGDPSPWTALGVFRAMETAVRRRLGAELSGMTIAVQGLGNVGYALCGLLHAAGAKLVVAEPRGDVASKAAAAFDARIMGSTALIAAEVDVLAPCALGAALNPDTIPTIRAKVVCGAANNQLSDPAQGKALADRGILYAPDYVVNAGGIINVAAEYLGWTQEDVQARVERIGHRLDEIFDLADVSGTTPDVAADSIAQQIIARRGKPASTEQGGMACRA